MLCFSMYYVLRKDDIKEITNSLTYEEMLEYNDGRPDRRQQRLEREKAEKLEKLAKEQQLEPKELPEYEENKRRVFPQYSSEEITTSSSNNYDRLLDALKLSPYQNE